MIDVIESTENLLFRDYRVGGCTKMEHNQTTAQFAPFVCFFLHFNLSVNDKIYPNGRKFYSESYKWTWLAFAYAVNSLGNYIMYRQEHQLLTQNKIAIDNSYFGGNKFESFHDKCYLTA